MSSDQNVVSNQPSSALQTNAIFGTLQIDSNEISFLRLPEVMFVTVLRKSSLYALIWSTSFPAPVKSGFRKFGWVGSEVMEWVSVALWPS
jgi:predicted DNA-binding transcriptional regulator AlpA